MHQYKRVLVLAVVLVMGCIGIFAVSRQEKKQEEIRISEAVILSLPADSVDAVSWNFAGDGFALSRTEDGWVYEADEAFPVSSEAMEEILANFEALSAAFVIDNPEGQELYGLDEPECTIELTAGEESYTILCGTYSKMDEQRYADLGDGKVYLLQDDPVDYMPSALSELIEHDDTPAFETVTEIHFSGEEDYSVMYAEESSHTYNPEDTYFTRHAGGTVPLDAEEIREILSTITNLELLDYATYHATEEELAAFGLDDPQVSITVSHSWLNDEDIQESGEFTLHVGENVAERQAADEAEANEEEIPDVTHYVRIGESPIVYTLTDVAYITLSNVDYDTLRHREVFWAPWEKVIGMDITLEGKSHSLTSAMEENEEGEEVRRWYFAEEELNISGLQSALEYLSADSFTEAGHGKTQEIALTVYLEDENFPQVDIELYRYDGSHCLAVVDGESVSLIPRADAMELVEEVQAIVLR